MQSSPGRNERRVRPDRARSRLSLHLPCVLLCALLAGCVGGGARDQAPIGPTAAGTAKPSADELDQRILAFADRYAVVLRAAVDEVCAATGDLALRREAHRLRAEGVMGVWDIATGPDSHGKILDLVLVVTLQSRIWIDEGTADTLYGPAGAVLEGALRQLRLDAWELAAQALTQPQLQELDNLILTWRSEHPGVRAVSFVRFDEAGAARGRALAAAVREGDGLLAPVDRAVDEAARARVMGERLFWLAKRGPLLLQWQSELAFDDLLLRPEVAEARSLAVGLPELVARERAAVLDGVARVLDGSQGVVRDGRATAEAVAATAASVERILALLAPALGGAADPAAKPFDIAEYAAALREAGALAQHGNEALGTVSRILGSNDLPARLDEVNRAASERVDHASQRAHQLMLAGFLYALGLLAALVLGLLALRRWGRR
jgi:hypothetical protein